MATARSTKAAKAPNKAAPKAKAKPASASAKAKGAAAKAKAKTSATGAAARKPKGKAAPAAAPKLTEAETSILHPLFNLRRQIDEMLNETVGRLPRFQLPKIEWPSFSRVETDTGIAKFDFSENDKAVTVTAEVPGMTEDDLEITLQDGVLAIRGEKKSEREEKGENFYLSERRFGSFSRAFRLPDGVKEDEISAGFKKGILTVTLPKAAKPKKAPRRVSVKSS